MADVAAIYRSHLAACAPPAPLRRAGGAVVVPGNRWDLVPATDPDPVPVSVVVPYYEAQRPLDLVLTALAAQTHPPSCVEVIVVDDGSRRPPDVGRAAPLDVTVLRQDDAGFRAARARNLGARAAGGDVLAFLDGDTVPEPGYLAALTRLPARCPDAVTVGRRRHADLSGVPPEELGDVLAGRVPRRELTEPAWLRDAYRDSADLLHADERSYRFVISAVLAMPARLYAEVGGFDERFVGYGGEDWELGHRCWQAGAVLAHVPEAVAWHDGPDWAERDLATRVGAKNAETLLLAALLPDPGARGSGQWLPYPAVLVLVPLMAAADLLATARSAFASGVDCGIWVESGPSLDERDAALLFADPRLHRGPPGAEQRARAQCVVDLHGPADLTSLPQLVEQALRHGRVDTPALTARSSRARQRSARWAGADGDADALADLLFGRHERSGPAVRRELDLAAALRDTVRPA